MLDFGWDCNTAAAVQKYDKAEVTTMPNEFARKAPVPGASMAKLADQSINDAAISTDGKGGPKAFSAYHIYVRNFINKKKETQGRYVQA